MPRSSGSVVSKTTTYAIANNDETVLCNGTFTVTLPTAVGLCGVMFIIKNVGTGTITVDTTSSQTIDGQLTLTISDQYTSLSVLSDGSNWSII